MPIAFAVVQQRHGVNAKGELGEGGYDLWLLTTTDELNLATSKLWKFASAAAVCCGDEDV